GQVENEDADRGEKKQDEHDEIREPAQSHTARRRRKGGERRSERIGGVGGHRQPTFLSFMVPITLPSMPVSSSVSPSRWTSQRARASPPIAGTFNPPISTS